MGLRRGMLICDVGTIEQNGCNVNKDDHLSHVIGCQIVDCRGFVGCDEAVVSCTLLA